MGARSKGWLGWRGSKQLSPGVAVQAGGYPWFVASVYTRAKLVPGPQVKVDMGEPDQRACRNISRVPRSPCHLALHMWILSQTNSY